MAHKEKRVGARRATGATGRFKAFFARGNTRLTLRQALLMVLLVVVMAVPVVFVNNPIGYVPIISLLLMLAMSWGCLMLSKRRLQVEAALESSACVRGGKIMFNVLLRNGTALPVVRIEPCFYISDAFGGVDKEVSSSTSLKGREQSDFSINVVFGHIGTYAVGMKEAVLYDPLGLFHARIPAQQLGSIEVTPRLVDASGVELSRTIMRESMKMVNVVASDDIDYAGVRDYVFGDPLKSIHWKLSARSDDLQTRLFETATNPELAVLVDFHAPAYELETAMECNDALVESALSIALEANARGFETHLTYFDVRGAKHHERVEGSAELARLSREFPLASPGVGGDLALELLRQEALSRGGCSNLLYCSAHLDAALVGELIRAKELRRNPVLLNVVPWAEREAFLKESRFAFSQLAGAGVPCHVVYDADDLVGAQ